MKVSILHLYHDLLNLYGEYGNINVLINHLRDQGVEVFLDKKTIGDDYNLLNYDFIYVGSGTEKHIMIALEDLKNHKNELEEYISSNKYALFTGDSIELLGKLIAEESSATPAINIFDYKTVRLKDRKTGDVILKSEKLDKEVVGFINKQSDLEGIDNPLFKVEFGIGSDKDNQVEGVRKNNLIATYTIGPLLVRNPHILKNIVKGIIFNKELDFQIKDIEYTNENEGYELVLNELKSREK